MLDDDPGVPTRECGRRGLGPDGPVAGDAVRGATGVSADYQVEEEDGGVGVDGTEPGWVDAGPGGGDAEGGHGEGLQVFDFIDQNRAVGSSGAGEEDLGGGVDGSSSSSSSFTNWSWGCKATAWRGGGGEGGEGVEEGCAEDDDDDDGGVEGEHGDEFDG